MNTATTQRIEGLWVPIVTPFEDDGTLDLASLGTLAEHLLSAGVDGLVALGTTGEPATLTAQERVDVVRVCAWACERAGRRLIVGAGTNSTQGTIDEVGLLTSSGGVDAVLIVAPYYTRPSEAAIVDHFHVVADASPVPVLAYNIPYRTCRGLDAASLLATAAHANIVGMKQSVGSLDVDTLELLRADSESFDLLAGDDAFIAPTILMGGSGAIAAAAHVCTEAFVELTAVARAEKAGEAAALAGRLLPVVRAGFAEPSPAVWKGALARSGLIASAQVRRPLTGASADAITALEDAVVAVGDRRGACVGEPTT